MHDIRKYEEIVHSTWMINRWVSDKGYIQLALRSGYYKKLNVIAIKEGELLRYDPLNEDIEVQLIEDFEDREDAKTIGYYAMFEYLNGFRKTMYWSKKKMMNHADKYSPAFSANGCEVRSQYGTKHKVSFEDYEAGNYDPKDAWMYSSFWYKDFDGMAYKTMLRQLISKWGIMSIEMTQAFEADMGVIKEDGSVNYVENAEMGEAEVIAETEEGDIIIEEPKPEPAPEAKAPRRSTRAKAQPVEAPDPSASDDIADLFF